MPDSWQKLRHLTPARIALGRAGGSVPTRELLEFRLAHARARDAVHAPFAAAALAERLGALGPGVLCLESAARTSVDFLRRPDMGRRLSEASRVRLREPTTPAKTSPPDVVVIVSDGLSSRAATEHAPTLLATLVPLLQHDQRTLAPLLVVTHGRVALQDEIGELLGARLSLMLLGERPGLGAADSLGAYFTYAPRMGLRDVARNCVSNIRPDGLPPSDAAHKLFGLMTQALQRQLSGVELKDDAPARISRPDSPPALPP